jgi:hypothetical protein
MTADTWGLLAGALAIGGMVAILVGVLNAVLRAQSKHATGVAVGSSID